MRKLSTLLAAALIASLIFNAVFVVRRLKREDNAKDATFEYFKGASTPFASAPNSVVSIIIAGDSIVDKCPWSEYLGVPVMARGIVGEWSSDLVFRIEELKRHHAKVLIILTGANDVHGLVPTASILANIRKVATAGIAPRCFVLGVLGADPAALSPLAVIALDEALAKEYGARYVAPPGTWAWKPDTFDGLHPNGLGYKLIAAEILKHAS